MTGARERAARGARRCDADFSVLLGFGELGLTLHLPAPYIVPGTDKRRRHNEKHQAGDGPCHAFDRGLGVTFKLLLLLII